MSNKLVNIKKLGKKWGIELPEKYKEFFNSDLPERLNEKRHKNGNGSPIWQGIS